MKKNFYIKHASQQVSDRCTVTFPDKFSQSFDNFNKIPKDIVSNNQQLLTPNTNISLVNHPHLDNPNYPYCWLAYRHTIFIICMPFFIPNTSSKTYQYNSVHSYKFVQVYQQQQSVRHHLRLLDPSQ